MTTPEIVISDLSACQPAAGLSRDQYRGAWRLVDYETVEGLAGTMVSAYPNEGAPNLQLPLDVRGRYRVYVGINYTRVPGGDLLHQSPWPMYGQTQLKFDGDPGFTRFALEVGWSVDTGWTHETGAAAQVASSGVGKSLQIYTSIQDTYWCTRDFDGPTVLTIAGMGEPYDTEAGSRMANLSYLRLVPESEDQAQEATRLAPSAGTRRLALQWCTGMLSGHAIGSPMYHPVSEQWFRDEMAPFVDSDVGVFILECVRGSLCIYRSKIGDVDPPGNVWDPSWVDPLECFTQLAHDAGMKIFSGLRMMGRGLPMVDAPIGRAGWFLDHPQFARRDRDGSLTNNVSLAFPEVRQYWLSLLRETLDYGVDGVMVYFHRGQPFVLFEEPVVVSFRERYGTDPRELPEDDPRLLRHWAGYVTEFLREVRALINEVPGRQLAVSVYGRPYKFDDISDFSPLRYNCDVETWIREGLVDYLMPTPTVSPALIRGWRDLAGDGMHIWPDLQPRVLPGEQSVARTREFYDAGADGLSLWDGERRPPHASHWAVMRRLGHRDDLESLARLAPALHRRVPLRKLDGYSVAHSFKDG